ncbi:MAG: CHAT domain-containing protein, partial [bacterium]
SFYVTEKRTWVWAIPHKGRAVFKTVPVGRDWVEQAVTRLRSALDVQASTFGEIPALDLAASHQLYRRLLAPVQSAWKGAKHLIVVPHGALGRLPLGLLTTAPAERSADGGLLFDRYRKAPWLIRLAAVTRVPSATSFVSLRNLPPGDPKRRAFAGFGDSWFNTEQATLAEKEKSAQDTSKMLAMNTRGIRITSRPGGKAKDRTGQAARAGGVSLDDSGANSVRLEMLQRLPDTRGEIQKIAEILGADLTQDVFLGRANSESRVKSMNLSNRRVIAFATHALVPGDLDGLRQPALALSSPSVTGGKGDGLLTMEEVMSLRLNADWVVLSACNTASADGKGAEAVSGLGRAFFYAGTRALLVSHWPVETTSATLLTTGIFRGQQKNPNWSRARALQQSMLHLIDRGVLTERSSGRKIVSYAHPIFWAPFTLIGDGGGGMGR